jgi:hypothetical protein
MPHSCRCAAARRFTASEVAAFRALRHKIVEPPDGGRLHSISVSSHRERIHDDVVHP